MIPEIGHYALVLTFGLALVQGTLPLVGAARRDQSLMALPVATSIGQFLFVTLAFGAASANAFSHRKDLAADPGQAEQGHGTDNIH